MTAGDRAASTVEDRPVEAQPGRSPQAASEQIEATPASPAPSAPAAPDVEGDLTEIWSRVREFAADKAASRALVGSLKLVSMAPGRAVVAVDDPSHLEYAKRRAEQIGQLFKEAVGAVVRVSVDESAARTSEPPRVREEDREAVEHPLVKKTMELFDARVVSIERDEEQSD